jgi:hypothetical protein
MNGAESLIGLVLTNGRRRNRKPHHHRTDADSG